MEWNEQTARLRWIDMIGGVEVVEAWILKYADSGKIKPEQMMRWRLAVKAWETK